MSLDSPKNKPSQLPFRDLLPTYICAPFGNGLFDAVLIIVPLYALSLGATPSQIGLIVGARYAMPFFFGIHGGALVDRLGAKRMSLIFGFITLALVPLYPLMVWFPALLTLQLMVGMTTSFSWIGIQTTIIHQTGGNMTFLGRFTFCQQIGATLAPILSGAVWDLTGVWGAFMFITGWTICFIIAASFIRTPDPAPAVMSRKTQWRDLLPRPSDYWSAFALMAIPAVALAMAVTVVRHTTTPIQASFYVVYLDQLGMPGTIIGAMIALVEITNGIGPLFAGYISRRFSSHWLLIGFSIISIFLISITPLLGGTIVLLGAIQIIRGLIQGSIQPIFMSTIAQAVSADIQGRSVGLRTTMNRLGALSVPIAMGYAVEAFGIEKGFYYTGAFLIFLLVIIGIVAYRSRLFGPLRNVQEP
ncbi:MAG: MFS transporter [Rhodospirillales bacterium]|jgi:MFS family permease